MGTSGIITLVVGILITIMGILGVGKNRRKNAWLVQLIGDIGYRIFVAAIGIAVIVMAILVY